MDTVIFTGGLPLDELKIDRPDEYCHLIKNNFIDKYRMEPLPSYKQKIINIFAWSALIVGFFIIIWIIYAIIFVYK